MKTRRPEFKRARKAKWRKNKRHPMQRILKDIYAGMKEGLLPLTTPLLMRIVARPSSTTIQWGGSGHYFDVVESSNMP